VKRLIKESNFNHVVRFKDGTYLGIFGKVDQLSDALQFNGDRSAEIHMRNNPIRLSELDYEIKTVKNEIQLID
jgi:hypothetical protein